MVQGVVDVFEIVDIGKQQVQLMIGCVCGYQVMVQCFLECQLVGQFGQCIGIGYVLYFVVMLGDGIVYVGEVVYQFVNFVVVGVFGQWCLVVVGFDVVCCSGQVLDWCNQGVLYVQDYYYVDYY